MNARVISNHFSVAHTMVAFTVVVFKVFTNRLPWGRPEVFGIIVSKVDVATWLVKVIEDVA